MKPIIISAEDVRGIRDGRKTMARLVIKPQPPEWEIFLTLSDDISIIRTDGRGMDRDRHVERLHATFEHDGWPEFPVSKAPYQPGDVLWVRETWTMLIDSKGDLECFYRADMENPTGYYKTTWRSPISMPREVARLFLRVTDVRVERVQNITATDAVREGVARGWGLNNVGCLAGGCYNGDFDKSCALCDVPVEGFRHLWDARNAKRGYSWSSNPWVWVIEFERVEKGAES